MEKLGRKIVRFRIPIFIIGLLLLIPSVFGYINTRVNYDVLYYLPDSIETMQGQDILVDEFGTGAYSMFICEGMENKDVAKLKEQIEDVEHVSKVVWYDSFAVISIPMEMLPEDIREAFNADDSTLMFIIFDTTTSADETMDAIENIRALAGKQCFLSGMSAIVTDHQEPGRIRGCNLRPDRSRSLLYRSGTDHGIVSDPGIFPVKHRHGDTV